jgi:PhnB protein
MKHMTRLDPYLNFNGNTEEAFMYYRSVFGGEFLTLMRFGDMPGSEKMNVHDRKKIMHVALPVGDSNILMGTDALESMNQKLTLGDNFSISITSDNEAEVKRMFDALAADGTVIMPLSSESWSPLFGILKDKYGVQWMLNYKK